MVQEILHIERVNLRDPETQMAKVVMWLRKGANKKIQREWTAQSFNPWLNFLNQYKQGKTTLVSSRQGIETQNDENL